MSHDHLDEIDDAVCAGMRFYARPEDLVPRQIDRLLRDTVSRINQSGWVWTAESCQGHPDSRDAAWADNTDPMLRLVCRHENMGRMLGLLMDAYYDHGPEMLWQQGFRIYPVKHRRGWVEILVYLNGKTAYYRDDGIRVLERFAELLSVGSLQGTETRGDR